MGCLRTLVIGGAAVSLYATSLQAADMPGSYPPLLPAAKSPTLLEAFTQGWYLRGDLGYRWNTLTAARSSTGLTDPIDNHLGQAGSATFGFGVKSQWLRTDLTFDYLSEAKYRGTLRTTDDVTAKIQAFTTLFNGYIDLGTWYGVTPYIGAGAGAAYARVSDYQSLVAPPLSGGSRSQWNVAYAGMAGIAFAVSHNTQIDVGYRYLNLGDVKTERDATGFMNFKNVASHELRVGLRWNFDDLRSFR